jgi:hypothetical protein
MWGPQRPCPKLDTLTVMWFVTLVPMWYNYGVEVPYANYNRETNSADD